MTLLQLVWIYLKSFAGWWPWLGDYVIRFDDKRLHPPIYIYLQGCLLRGVIELNCDTKESIIRTDENPEFPYALELGEWVEETDGNSIHARLRVDYFEFRPNVPEQMNQVPARFRNHVQSQQGLE